jgi:glycosyltransferase involved in cell wall biosynthesis
MNEADLDQSTFSDESLSAGLAPRELKARVLVLFGNIPLLGKERGNIQALKVLAEQGGEVLFVTNKKWGHESIQPMLDKLGLAWTPMTVARPLRRMMSVTDVLGVVRDIVVGWVEFYCVIRRYKPTHIHIPNEYQSVYNLPVLAASGVPIVYRLGDTPVETPRFLRELWSRLVVPSVSCFVCISEFIKREAIKAGASEEKIRVIYNFPPERPSLPPEDRIRVEPFAGRTVLYMGQLSEEKGVDLLVEAAIDLCHTRDDVRFLIAGDYTWQNPFAEGLMEQVRALGLSERIQFLGYVKDIPGLLAVADIHVCPSVWEEPLSNVVPEAKQAGVPSVIFPSGGLPELVTHEQDGYVCREKSAEALKEGIEHFLDTDKERLDAAGLAARVSLEQLGITRQAFTEAWREVYESI